MTIFISILLMSIGLISGAFDVLIEGETELWVKSVKVAVAALTFTVGLWQALEGFIHKSMGLNLLSAKDYSKAIYRLEKVSKTFADGPDVDFALAKAYKGIADNFPTLEFANHYYEKAIAIYKELSGKKRNDPRIKNNLLNIYRRQGRWDLAEPLAIQFAAELSLPSYFNIENKLMDAEHFAIAFVALGTLHFDKNNPRKSIPEAVEFYRKAMAKDPENKFVLQNLPPALLDLSDIVADPKDKIDLVAEAFILAEKGTCLQELGDKVFSYLNLICVASNPLFIKMPNQNGQSLIGYLEIFEKLIDDAQKDNPEVYIDVETWLVLANQFQKLKNHIKFEKYLRLSLIHIDRFNKLQQEEYYTLSAQQAVGLDHRLRA